MRRQHLRGSKWSMAQCIHHRHRLLRSMLFPWLFHSVHNCKRSESFTIWRIASKLCSITGGRIASKLCSVNAVFMWFHYASNFDGNENWKNKIPIGIFFPTTLQHYWATKVPRHCLASCTSWHVASNHGESHEPIDDHICFFQATIDWWRDSNFAPIYLPHCFRIIEIGNISLL